MNHQLALPFTLSLVAVSVAAAPLPPPGHNVHLVVQTPAGRFWRGGAPSEATIQALARTAKERGRSVTLVDLRTPPNRDDQSGKDGRLAPKAEAELAKRLGLKYVSVSALDKSLPSRLKEAAQSGDVYIHCMYGVNRTGFAVARYARATGQQVDRAGLGKRDYNQGDAFQARVSHSR